MKSSFVWQPFPLCDPSGLLEQREGHSSCLLGAQGTGKYLIVAGGYSANSSPTDITAVHLTLSDADSEVLATGEVSVVGSSPLVARDGGVLHTIPSAPTLALGFGGIDNDDSYEHVNSCYCLSATNIAGGGGGEGVVVSAVEVVIDGLAPPPRCRPASSMISPAIDPTGQDIEGKIAMPSDWRLIIFGGEGADGASLNDLWLLQPSTGLGLRWITVNCNAPPSPSPRYLSAFPNSITLSPTVNEVSLLLFGGADSQEAKVTSLNDLWSLEICDMPTDKEAGHTGVWRQIAMDTTEDTVAAVPPRSNGHVGAQLSAGQTMFFAGKDFALGNDDIHIFTSLKDGAHSHHYTRIPCPYAGDEEQYVNIEEDVGGTGKGVWPHWRYTPTLIQWPLANERGILLLICGECRHTDAGTPVYIMKY